MMEIQSHIIHWDGKVIIRNPRLFTLVPSYSSPVLASLACRSNPQGAQASQRLPPALAPSSTISLSCSQQLLFNCISTLLALSCTLFAASLSLDLLSSSLLVSSPSSKTVRRHGG